MINMIITISGKPGSGKSTVGKILAKKLGYDNFSTGDFMRQMAEERDVTILELNKIAQKDATIDEELDTRQKHLGIENDNFVLDARLGYHFIPKSFKIFLDVNIDVAAQRIASDTQESRNVEGVGSIADAKHKMQARLAEEKTRWQKIYQLNPFDLSQYDLVIDTTDIDVEHVIKRILLALPNWQLGHLIIDYNVGSNHDAVP